MVQRFDARDGYPYPNNKGTLVAYEDYEKLEHKRNVLYQELAGVAVLLYNAQEDKKELSENVNMLVEENKKMEVILKSYYALHFESAIANLREEITQLRAELKKEKEFYDRYIDELLARIHEW